MSEALLGQPDSPLVSATRPSPNHGPRRGYAAPDCIVLHYTGMKDGAAALDRLCAAASEVSSHYVVEEDGTVIQLVAETLRAHHAGRSFWAGETDMNSASIGLEIVNGGHDFGLPPFPERQIAAVVALCRDVMARHAIARRRVLAHSDVAPSRKQDPGERFPWRVLADAGVGVWVSPGEPTAGGLGPGLAGDAVSTLQRQLGAVGYGVDPTGLYDPATEMVVRAFQRRFRPSRIDGVADAGTVETLQRLIDRVSDPR